MAILAEPIKKMYDDTGRVDAKAVAAALGEKTAAMASAFDVKPNTLQKNPKSEAIQKRGQRLIGILDELTQYFDGDFKSAMVWMRRSHPQLDNLSPLDVIKQGKIEVIAGLVHAIGTGEPR